jgi:acyl carrier protein
VKKHLQDFIEGELLSGRTVTSDEDLLVSELLDSLAVMRLVAFIRKTLGISVPARDVTLANFSTIDAMAAYLERLTADQGADGG